MLASGESGKACPVWCSTSSSPNTHVRRVSMKSERRKLRFFSSSFLSPFAFSSFLSPSFGGPSAFGGSAPGGAGGVGGVGGVGGGGLRIASARTLASAAFGPVPCAI
jgi:hypothetical protein